VEWHVITGEYPPKWGGVSDYTYRICQELGRDGEQVHVWSPGNQSEAPHPEKAEVHALPTGFGRRWLGELDRQLRSFEGPRTILIQYVPHMYGWKAMNLPFCWWIFKQRKHNVFVMFHEVAFPFRRGQRLRHALLATVHRMMAWLILRSVRHSFTSTELYMALLQTLGNDRTPVSLLRICSNIPMENHPPVMRPAPEQVYASAGFRVGIFSNFNYQLREVLEPAIGLLLENPEVEVLLLGPGNQFRDALIEKYPQAGERIQTTGRLRAANVGPHMRRCNALLQLYPDGASAARGTLIAAMASGVPVVTAAGPATDRLLLESRAMLFADQSAESIRQAIELLIVNPTLSRDLAARAEKLYQESFQPAVIVSRIRHAVHGTSSRRVEQAALAAD